MADKNDQRIGDQLVAEGIITRGQAEAAAVQTVLARTRTASVLVQNGVDESAILRALSARTGVPAIDLARCIVPAEVFQRVPVAIARQHGVFPVGIEGKSLLVAMQDPASQQLLDEVSFATGLNVIPLVALHQRVQEAIGKAYSAAGEPYKGEAAPDDASADPKLIPLALPRRAEEAVKRLRELGLQSRDEPEQTRGPPAGEHQSDSTQTRERALLLVVDDEADIRELVVRGLEPLGHEIIAAERGLEALHRIKDDKPDLIVLDAMLPEVHGFEICRKVKESKRFCNTPVLMISAIYRGWRVADDIRALYKVDRFLEKPFRLSELRQQVEELLEEASGAPAQAPVPEGIFGEALSAYRGGDLNAAERKLQEAERAEPFSPEVQFMMARVLEKQSQPFAALDRYERAVELAPQMHAASRNLALLYETLGFRMKAAEMWQRSLHSTSDPEVRTLIQKFLESDQ